jgi:predicted RNA binding protein YcfA (HicA-like mRNA interferase family)/predicted RNase H-like HicB family nuclease
MKFSELVRLLERSGFTLLKEKGSIRYYRKPGHDRLLRVDYHGSKEVPTGTCHAILRQPALRRGVREMIDLKYSLVIEATADPNFFGFYSPELQGFTGVGNSIEDCLYKARWGIEEHLALLREQKLSVPDPNPNPTVVVQNAEHVAPAA